MSALSDTASVRFDRLISVCIAGIAPALAGAVGFAAALPQDAGVPALGRPEVLAVVSLANIVVGAGVFVVLSAAWAGLALWREGRRAPLCPALGGSLAVTATVAAAVPFCYDTVKAVLSGHFTEAYRLPLAAVAATVLGLGVARALAGVVAGPARPSRILRWLFAAVVVASAGAITALFLHHQGHPSDPANPVGPAWAWMLPLTIALIACLPLAARHPRVTVALALAISLAPVAALLLQPTSLPVPRPGAIPTGSPKTVLLLTIDTLRRDVVDAYNPEGGLMPTLGALARQSVVFDDAHAPSPWTRPSMASILTGLSPLVHGVTKTDRVLPEQVASLAEIFRENGYRTVGAGSNHNLLREFGFARGFDEYAMGSEPRGSSLGAGALKLFMRSWFTTRGITDRALDALTSAGDGPLFLWVHYLTPHIPYAPPAAYLPDAEPAGDIGVFFGDAPREDPAEVNRSQPLSEAERTWVRALYDAEVRYADAAVAELLAALKAAGRYEDAVIAFTADHGEEFWDHGAFEHGHAMYGEVLQMPLFVRPGGSAGVVAPKRIHRRVSTHALFPTLLELAGLPVPEDKVDVASLVPLWSANPPTVAPRPHVASATLYGEPQSAILDGDHKLIVRHTTQTRELYNVGTDPGERHNLATEQPGLVQRLETLLQIAQDQAQAQRLRLGMQGDNRVDMSADTAEQLRELGYIR